jgi:hypothetical protein
MGATGFVEVSFGAFPGKSEAQADVVTAGVIETSRVEGWVEPKLVSDSSHSLDEHKVESIRVSAHWLSNGNVRITAYAVPFPQLRKINSGIGRGGDTEQKHLLHGLFNIGWAWL